MLFNSLEFIFLFFPGVVFLFFVIGRWNQTAAAGWLGLASLFFYGYWSMRGLPLLAGSIMLNYFFGKKLAPAAIGSERKRKLLLGFAVTTNLVILGFFKYANFFIENVNLVLGALSAGQLETLNIVLPIGISFFTFTQIAFLVNSYKGKVKERNFTHYLLFVTYFPHLVAGPVLHHSQMMPQFGKSETYRLDIRKVALGLTIFTFGLSKKLLLADPLGENANLLFASVNEGITPMFFMSWLGVLSYTFQIYFDFSGYSDMAIGISLFFGIVLPINFDSPYRSLNIIDFWRRWHISLSTFLRDYLYISLGGNRFGRVRRYLNLLITMLLGGLWHGASWTFVFWGAIHGFFLIVNHVWQKLVNTEKEARTWLGSAASWLITFLAVVFAWVFFRSESLPIAGKIYRGLIGANGVSLPEGLMRTRLGGFLAAREFVYNGFWPGMVPGTVVRCFLLLGVAFFVALCLPSTSSYLRDDLESIAKGDMVIGGSRHLLFRKGAFVGVLFLCCLLAIYTNVPSRFLYFQF